MLLRVYLRLPAGHRRQGHDGDIPLASSGVGKREEPNVTATRGPGPRGPLPTTEETEAPRRRRGQQCAGLREEGRELRALNGGPFESLEKGRYVTAHVEKKGRMVVRTGVVEGFSTNIIEFL